MSEVGKEWKVKEKKEEGRRKKKDGYICFVAKHIHHAVARRGN
jgi:hypothetical protein